MKLLSYSLFGALPTGADSWEFLCYLRGFYFNVLMNKMIYPGWRTVVHVDEITEEKYRFFFNLLYVYEGIAFSIMKPDNHCRSMLWRMMPIFLYDNLEAILCRDADALTSYREAQCVAEWMRSDCVVHSIHDNVAHSVPLLGGLCGFKAESIRDKYGSYEAMIAKAQRPIDKHGTDQQFLTDIIYSDWQHSMMLHNLKGTKTHCSNAMNYVDEAMNPEGVAPELWTSNLCSAFIGSAGVNEMETLRWFRDHLPDWGSDYELWRQYPKIFWWL